MIGAPRRQIASMTVLRGAQALRLLGAVNYWCWREGARNGMRTGGTKSLRDLRAPASAILISWWCVRTRTHTRARTHRRRFCDVAIKSVRCFRQLYTEHVKVVFTSVNYSSLNSIFWGTIHRLFSPHLASHPLSFL